MSSSRKTHIRTRIQRTKPKELIFRKMWFWITLSAMVIVFCFVYFYFFYSEFQLKNIVISGNTKVTTQDLKNIVASHSSTGLINFLNIKISSQSLFIINKDQISKDILNKYPVIEKLTISKKLPQTIILGITERKPLGVFCPASNTDQTGRGCFLIDQNGIIFEPLAVPEQGVTIVRQAVENSRIYAGERVLDQKTIGDIFQIQKNLLDNFKINLNEALVTSPIRLDVSTSDNWKAYFDLSGDSNIDSQLQKLNLLLAGKIPEESLKNLRYIDLRPKDRAIVCDNSVCGG